MKKLILCKILGLHGWTSPSIQCVKPDPSTTKEEFIASFTKHCTVTCSRCGIESEVSKEWRERITEKLKEI